jgi:hypothetical protein
MALEILNRGENRLLKRSLFLADGVTALPVASLSGARVQLVQRGTVKTTAVLGVDAALHQGGNASELVYEITSAVSAALRADDVLVARWTIKLPDAAFVAEPGGLHIDVIEEDVFLVK